MPDSKSEPPHFFGPPVQVSFDELGRPSYTALLLEDFETAFSARLREGETYRDITHEVNWEVTQGKGKHVWVKNEKNKHKLTGYKKGEAWLRATYKDKSTDIKLLVMESDLLIYAPDGLVYRVPGQVWLQGKAQSLDGKSIEEVEALKWGERLPEPIWNMLDNEVTLANIPNEARNQPEVGAPKAENVTCFLLNLNSIMLSYAPPKATKGAQARAQRATWQVDPPPAQPPARKKRR